MGNFERINVNKVNGNFTQIYNYIFKDKRINFKTRGLFCTMLSLPPEWDLSVKGLETLTEDGRDSIKASLKTLEECGYLTRTQTRDDQGRVGKMDYQLYEVPYELFERINAGFSPQTDLPSTDLPSTANPPQYNTINNKDLNNKENIYSASETHDVSAPFKSGVKNYETVVRILKYLNEKAHTNYKTGKSTCTTAARFINGRLNDGFSEDDFYKVIDIKTDDWLDTDSQKYLRPMTLFSKEHFEDYLNQKPVTKKRSYDIDPGQREDMDDDLLSVKE